jgi:hypothetical protein
MKKIILLLAIILLPVAGFAQSGTVGSLTWSLAGGTLTVSGTGAMPDSNFPWRSYNGSITSVVVESGVTSIGNYAFELCEVLTSVTIPNSVTNIGHTAFSSCNLTSITIPKSVTSIGIHAFWNCDNLASFTVEAENPSYSSDGGVLFNKDKTALIQYPKRKTGDYYDIPTGVTSIEMDAFYICARLTSIAIPKSVTSIGFGAFYFCYQLTDVAVGWATPLSIGGSDAFDRVPLASCTLHVPAGTKALYQAADVWKDFGTIIDDSSVGNVPLYQTVGVTCYQGVLSVNTPVSEQVEVYSVSGQLLYKAQKAVGEATFNLNHLPKGVLIVKGSTGWVRKIVNNK